VAEIGVRPVLDADRLQNPTTEVTARDEQKVIANLLEALDYPDGIGLAAGKRYHLTRQELLNAPLSISPQKALLFGNFSTKYGSDSPRRCCFLVG
jgi:hypothetical protein